MQCPIYIQESHLAIMPICQFKKPRERFIKYYQDLYVLHDDLLSTETFYSGSQYTYAELGDAVLKKYKKDDIDMLFLVTWAPEFDPDYASVGTYFVHRHQLNCKVYDISDQGTLSFFTAVDLARKYLVFSQNKSVVILVMEQTTIPRNLSRFVVLPKHNLVFSIKLSKKKEKHRFNYQVIFSEIIQEEDLLKTTENFFLFFKINHFLAEKNKESLLVVHQDAETHSMGRMLLRREGNE